MEKIPVLVSWSGGKDSALALATILADDRYTVAALMTTLTEEESLVAMHRVGRELIRAQARALKIPLHEVTLPSFPSNEVYEQRMNAFYAPFREKGIRHVVFGDLFLADIRSYRERIHHAMGMQCLFPLWGEDTTLLLGRFHHEGYSAVICCVDLERGNADWSGKWLDKGFAAHLPRGIDPCGEHGEFHTFVTGGPLFEKNLAVKVQGNYQEKGFIYAIITLDAPC